MTKIVYTLLFHTDSAEESSVEVYGDLSSLGQRARSFENLADEELDASLAKMSDPPTLRQLQKFFKTLSLFQDSYIVKKQKII